MLVGVAASSLQAATFTVTRTNNTGPGSLPVIVTQANAAPGDQTIEFAVSGTITLVSPLPTITNNLTINGRVDSPVIISGGGTTPIFAFAAGTTNILNQLTVANGKTTDDGGAAVKNAGTLFVTECQLINNAAQNGSGGAISNAGTMTIVASALSGNQAASGGAIYNSGNVTIADSGLLNNQAGTGGGIYNVGQTEIERCTLSYNSAVMGLGGGLFNGGQFTASSSTWTYNLARGGSGALGNTGGPGCGGGGGGGGSAAFGGAIYVRTGSLALTNCTISANSSQGGQGGNGGAANSSWPLWTGGNGGNGGGVGGGLGGIGATTLLPNARYATNGSSGAFGAGGGGGGAGAKYDSGGSPVGTDYPYGKPGGAGGFGGGKGGYGGDATNQFGNLCTPGYGGDGGSGFGGGAFCLSGSIFIINSTVSQNYAVGGNGGSVAGWRGGVQQGLNGTGVTGGLYNYGATVLLLNTIIANNGAPYTNVDVSGTFVSHGFNLIGNNQGATGLSINDYQNVSADLGPLQDNGGPTLTCALLQGSLAIGSGTSVGAPTSDQRGVPRPPGHCDIGAFQLITLIMPTITWLKPADISYGTPLGSGQLDATVGAAGTLSYTPPTGTVLSAGSNQVLQVVFTPADPSQYTGATNSVTLTVQKAAQTITFSPIPNHQIGDAPIILSPSASSGLPVTLAVLSGPAMMTGNLLSFRSTNGWVTVAATQPGNSNYNAAPELDRTFYLGTFPLPVVTTQPASQSVYPGDRVALSVTATNGPLNYQWQFLGRDITGGTSPDLVLARVQAAEAGPYRVIVSNPSGSVTSAVANLTVIISAGTPTVTAQPQGQIIRAGENAKLLVVATGAAPLSYQWYQGASGNTNGSIAGATSSAYIASALSTNTSFWVSVHNPLGTVDSATASVAVFPAKAARLKLTRLNGMAALVFDGLPGTQYRLDYTTNLSTASWSNVINLVLPSSPYTFIDATSLNAPLRFYRAVAQ